MIRFVDTLPEHCRRPVSGLPGPDMLVCGEPAMPGKTSCIDCRARLYYRPTNTELKNIGWTAGKPLVARRK